MGLKEQSRRDNEADGWIASVENHLAEQSGLIYSIESNKYWHNLLNNRRDAYVTIRLYNASARDVFPESVWTGKNSSIRYYQSVEDCGFVEIAEMDKSFY